MTREEEIKQSCADNGFPYGACSSISSLKANIATEAIKWADKTTLEKASQWLKRFLDSTVKKPSQVDGCTSDAIDLIEIRRQEVIRRVIYDFITSMEE